MTIGETTALRPTGGVTWEDGTYGYHMFTEGGTFAPGDLTIDADVLIVAAAGGGGWRGGNPSGGGGAGAGGVRWETGVTVSSDTDVVIGVGGGTNDEAAGDDGGDSEFGALVAVGGAGGAYFDADGGDGGSGGGAAGRTSSTGGVGGSGTAGQGNDGGDRDHVIADASEEGGGAGGGGADEDGGPTTSGADGSPGGDGLDFSAIFGTDVGDDGWFGGGGGGGHADSGEPGTGGKGGGGDGASDGQPNTGGGGGGGANFGTPPPGEGGSGVVILRYLLADIPLVLTAGAEFHVHGQALDVSDITGWTVDADARAHRLAHVMRADLPAPEVETWRVELLERETWQPPVGLGPDTKPTIDSVPTLELSSVPKWEFSVAPDAPMVPVLRAQERLPDLTARVWRGPEIVDQGPVTAAPVDPADGRVHVTVESQWHHMVRSTIGPAETPNIMTNPDFAQGLAGWLPVQSDSRNDYPFLVPVTPGAVSVVAPGGSRPGTPTGRGRWARLRGDLTDPQPLSISQVHRGVVSPTDRDIQIRALAVFYLPDGAAERTNQNVAVAIGAYPSGYSFPQDSFVAAAEAHRSGTQRIAEWPEPAARGRFLAISEEVTLRAGSGVRDVVVTIGAPFAECLVTGTFATVSDALVAQGTVVDVFDALVGHGQDDEILGHVGHGLSVIGVEQGDLPHLDEQWGWHEHVGIGSAVDALVSGGLGEWRVVHHMTGSTVEVLARDIDGVLADPGERLDITVTDRHQPSWIASLAVRQDWAAGASTVVAQSAGTQAFHERGAVSDDPLGWTDVATMPDHVPPWRAGPWAQRLLELAAKRDQLLVHYGEDAPRAWHRLRPGARCDVNLDVQGVQMAGRMLVRSHQLRPGAGGILSLTEAV